MANYDSAKRSELVKLQLRDKNGRWVVQGKRAKWYSKSSHKMMTGTIVGTDGAFAIMVPPLENPTHRPKPYKVPLSSLGMTNPKASLDKRDKGTKDAEKKYQEEIKDRFDKSLDPSKRNQSRERNAIAQDGEKNGLDADNVEFDDEGKPTLAKREAKSGTNEALEEFRKALEELTKNNNASSLEVGHGDDKITVSIDAQTSPTNNPSRRREVIFKDQEGNELARTSVFSEEEGQEKTAAQQILDTVDDFTNDSNNDEITDLDNDGIPDDQDPEVEAPGVTVSKDQEGNVTNVDVSNPTEAKKSADRMADGAEKDAINNELESTGDVPTKERLKGINQVIDADGNVYTREKDSDHWRMMGVRPDGSKSDNTDRIHEDSLPDSARKLTSEEFDSYSKAMDDAISETQRNNPASAKPKKSAVSPVDQVAKVLEGKTTGYQVELYDATGKKIGVASKLENGKYYLKHNGKNTSTTLTANDLAKRAMPPNAKQPLLKSVDKPSDIDNPDVDITNPVTPKASSTKSVPVPENISDASLENRKPSNNEGGLTLNDNGDGYNSVLRDDLPSLSDDDLQDLLYDSTQSLASKRNYIRELGRRIKENEGRELTNDDLSLDMFASNSYWNDENSYAKTKDDKLVQIGDTFLLSTGYILDEAKTQESGVPIRTNEKDAVQVMVVGMTSNGGLRVVPVQTHTTYLDDHKAEGASSMQAKEKTYDLLSLVDRQLLGVRAEPSRLWSLDGTEPALQKNMVNTSSTGRQAGHRGSHSKDEIEARGTTRAKASGYAADGTEVNVGSKIRFRSTSGNLERDKNNDPIEYEGDVIGVNKAGQNFRVRVLKDGQPVLDKNGNQVIVGVSDKQSVDIDSPYEAPIKSMSNGNFPPTDLADPNLTRDANGKVISKERAAEVAYNDARASNPAGEKDDSMQYNPNDSVRTDSQPTLAEILKDEEEDVDPGLPDIGDEEEVADDLPDTSIEESSPTFEGTPVDRPERADQIEADGNPVLDFLELDNSDPDNARKFREAITASKQNNKFGDSVYVYDEDEYKDMKLFATEDGSVGFAVKPDGDIVSVFNNKDIKDHGGSVVPSLLATAVEQGGTKLDAFDTVLPKLYAKEGFKPVGRDKWDDQYAPENWNSEGQYDKYNGGKPDVVYMEYDKDRIGSEYDPNEGDYSDSASQDSVDNAASNEPEVSETPKTEENTEPTTRENKEPMYHGPQNPTKRKGTTDAQEGNLRGGDGKMELPENASKEAEQVQKRLGTRNFAFEGTTPYENWMSRFAGNLRKKTFRNNEARSRYIVENAPVGFQVATPDGGYALKVTDDRWELKEGTGNRIIRATTNDRVRKYLNKVGDWDANTPEAERPQYKSPTKSAYNRNLKTLGEQTAGELKNSQPGTKLEVDTGDGSKTTVERNPKTNSWESSDGSNLLSLDDLDMSQRVTEGTATPVVTDSPSDKLFKGDPDIVAYMGRDAYSLDPKDPNKVRKFRVKSLDEIKEIIAENDRRYSEGRTDFAESGEGPTYSSLSLDEFNNEYNANKDKFHMDGPVVKPTILDLNSDENTINQTVESNADSALNNADSLVEGSTVSWVTHSGNTMSARKVSGTWLAGASDEADDDYIYANRKYKTKNLRDLLLDDTVGAVEESDLGDDDLDEFISVHQPSKKVNPGESNISARNKEIFNKDSLSSGDINELIGQGREDSIDFSGATLPEIQGFMNTLSGTKIHLFATDYSNSARTLDEDGPYDTSGLYTHLEGIAQSMLKYPHIDPPESITVSGRTSAYAYISPHASGGYSIGISSNASNRRHSAKSEGSSDTEDSNGMSWVYSDGGRSIANHEFGHAIANQDSPGANLHNSDKAFAEPALARFLGISVENLRGMSVNDVRDALTRRGGYSVYQTDAYADPSLTGSAEYFNWPEFFAEAVADVDLNGVNATPLSKYLYAILMRRSHKSYKGVWEPGQATPEDINKLLDEASIDVNLPNVDNQ